MTALDEIELRGRAQMLLDLLTARFGTVPAAVSARIHAADKATLTRWAVRMLSASSLKDVLDGESDKARSPRKSAGRRRAARS